MSDGTVKINRRLFLASGSALIALPAFESLMSSKAQAAANDPRRFVCMYIPNGTYMKPNAGANWFPGTAGALSANNLPVTFQPFASNVSDFSIVRGIHNADGDSTPFGGQHSKGISGFLTCAPARQDVDYCTISGDSFDQMIAAGLGGKPTLNMCGGAIGDQRADSTKFPYGENLVYSGGNAKRPYRSPVNLFNDLFSKITGTTAPPQTNPQATMIRNGSVLDNAVSNINNLKSQLGRRDIIKLDSFLTQLRELEKKYAASGGGGGGSSGGNCQPIAAPSSDLAKEDYYGDMTNFPQRLKAYCDMLVLAFKCDMMRSVTLSFDTEAASRRFKNKVPTNLIYQNADMGEEESHIGMSHYGDDPGAKQGRCVTRDRFYLSYMFYVINQLKAVTDVSGSSMLDNTIILTGHGITDGNHDASGIYQVGLPLVVGGGRNMIRPGNYYDHQNKELKDLLYTINAKLGGGLANFRGSTTLLNL